MTKPKPASLEYSNSKIQAEKLAVLRRTESKMAEILRLCPPDPDLTSKLPKLEVAILLFVLLLYTALTLFSKCDCVVNTSSRRRREGVQAHQYTQDTGTQWSTIREPGKK